MEFMLQNIPLVLQYFVPGFVFIALYGFMRFQYGGRDMSGQILKSVAISIVIVSAINLIPGALNLNEYARILLYSGICGVAAFVSAKVISAKWLNRLLAALGIRRTTSPTIWHDIVPASGRWIYFYDKELRYRYLGWVKHVEDNSGTPNVVLTHYTIEKLLDEPTGNESPLAEFDDDEHMLVLNVADASRIEVLP